jgi:Protein of unknown function (DUF1329)
MRKVLIIAVLLLTYAGSALGALSAEDAKKLGTTLTEIGAEKSGNADGSIPAYTGGLTTLPAGFKQGSGVRPDPFADEKPLYSITAANMAQFADKLTEGSKALLQKYPTYRMDLYKSHRTVAYPRYLLDNTLKNAVTAVTAEKGNVLRNAKGGIPFPLPKDGYEAIWNHLTSYRGEAYTILATSWNISASGRKILSSQAEVFFDWPYSFRQNPNLEILMKKAIYTNAPDRYNGGAIIVIDAVNPAEKARIVYQYIPGQRRVRLVSDIAFDLPDSGTSGALTYDDVDIFNGSMERFDFRLMGKKEMIVPYNDYRLLYQTSIDEMALPGHLNPDHVRWELHRVWVVEATLKPEKRHVYSKRIFYLDEDSWAALASDRYNQSGQLFRTIFANMAYSYDAQAIFLDSYCNYDLINGSYNIINMLGGGGWLRYTAPRPEQEWSPDALAGSGVR